MTASLRSRGVMLPGPLQILPAMLDHLGPALFGVWVAGTSIITRAAFMDFRIGNSLLARLSVYHGQRHEAASLRSIRAAYLILGPVSAAGLGLLGLLRGILRLWPKRSLGVLTAVGMNAGSPLILYTLGSQVVTDFAPPSRIGTVQLLVVVGAVFMPQWGVSGAAMARREYALVRTDTLRMSLGVRLAFIAPGAVLTLGTDLIMQGRVGWAFPEQVLVIVTMTVATTVIALTSPYNMVLNAAGKVKVQIWGWGTFVLLSVIAKLVLIPVFGAWIVAGVVYAVCISPAIILSALSVTRNTRGTSDRKIRWRACGTAVLR